MKQRQELAKDTVASVFSMDFSDTDKFFRVPKHLAKRKVFLTEQEALECEKLFMHYINPWRKRAALDTPANLRYDAS